MKEKILDRITCNMGSFIRVFYILKNKSESAGMKPPALDAQYWILGFLRNGPLNMSELSHRLQRSKPNMTALIGKLIREGLVDRVQEKTDQRIIRVELTEKGRKFIDERKKIAKEAIRANLEPLAEQDLNELCESLEKINRIIAKLNEI